MSQQEDVKFAEIEDKHISTLSSVLTALGTIPAAFLASNKVLATVLSGVAGLLAVAVMGMRLHNSVAAKHRRKMLRGGLIFILLLSWGLLAYSWYQMRRPVAAQSNGATAPQPPANTVLNQTTNGYGSPIVNNNSGSINIGGSTSNAPRRGNHK